jgi:hypothetical protein
MPGHPAMPPFLYLFIFLKQKFMENLQQVFTSLKNGEQEQTQIERTLGQALLQKIGNKKNVDLPGIYKELGGTDAIATALLGKLSNPFNKINAAAPAEIAKEFAINDALVKAEAKGSGSKKNAAFENNAALRISGQALHTLATLGGPEFNAAFHIK